MNKSPAVKFIFTDPNTPEAFEAFLKKLLLEKLLTQVLDFPTI